MSGPIVRKYGFPNFEKIFGERSLEHGADEAEPTPQAKADADTKANPSGGTNEEVKPAAKASKPPKT